MKLPTIMLAAAAVLILSGALLLVGDIVNSKWDGRTVFTVIDINNGMEIESIDAQSNKGIRLFFPDNFGIDTVGGRGEWMVKSMKKLAEKFGNKWAADSMADYLGIGYTSEKNSLGFWDKFQWWRISGQADWTSVNLGDTGYIVDKKEADGTIVKKLDITWQRKAREWFQDDAIAAENINVTLINTTSQDGLGSHGAVVIENTGLKVAMVKSQPDALNKCEISGTDRAMKTLSVHWLFEFFGCDRKINAEGSDTEVTVRLGAGYRSWWKGQF